MAALGLGCFLSLWGKSLARRESPLSFQLPRHSVLTNCEREVVNDIRFLFMARARPRPPGEPAMFFLCCPTTSRSSDRPWLTPGRWEKAQRCWEHGYDSIIQDPLPTKCLKTLEGSVGSPDSGETRRGNTFCRSPRKSNSPGTYLRCGKSHKHGYPTGACLHP